MSYLFLLAFVISPYCEAQFSTLLPVDHEDGFHARAPQFLVEALRYASMTEPILLLVVLVAVQEAEFAAQPIQHSLNP